MSEIRDFILSEISENLNFLEPEYDCCIVDVSTDSCHVIYDWNKMIEHRMKLMVKQMMKQLSF